MEKNGNNYIQHTVQYKNNQLHFFHFVTSEEYILYLGSSSTLILLECTCLPHSYKIQTKQSIRSAREGKKE